MKSKDKKRPSKSCIASWGHEADEGTNRRRLSTFGKYIRKGKRANKVLAT